MAISRTLGRGLGAFSLGLGTIQLLAPRRLLRATGFRAGDTSRRIVRAIGARELVAGAGLLAQRWPTPFAWFRVAGDAMDLALMGSIARRRGIRRDRATAVIGAVAAVSVADLAAGVMLARGASKQRADGESASGAQPVRASVTIARSPEEVYGFWRELGNLPRFMRHLEEVRETGPGRSHWVARAPVAGEVTWDAEITQDRPNELIAWAAVPGSGVQNSGSVTFRTAPGDRGTEVDVELVYEPPAGPLGVIVTRLFGEEPQQQTSDDLRRLKQVMETGEVVRSEATVEGRRITQRPAQPLDEASGNGRHGPAEHDERRDGAADAEQHATAGV